MKTNELTSVHIVVGLISVIILTYIYTFPIVGLILALSKVVHIDLIYNTNAKILISIALILACSTVIYIFKSNDNIFQRKIQSLINNKYINRTVMQNDISNKTSKLCKMSIVLYVFGWLCFPLIFTYACFSINQSNGYGLVFVIYAGFILMGAFHCIGLLMAIFSQRCKNKPISIILNLFSLPILYLMLCVYL